MSVISMGKWRCFICGALGERGWRGFTSHYDVHHLESAD